MPTTAQFTFEDAQINEPQTEYAGYFTIYKFHFRHKLFAGSWSKEITRELVYRGEAVAVLLYDETCDKVALIEQFRIGAFEDEKSPWLLELVAGMADSNEKPEEVAKRETKEEANCVIEKLIPICTCYVSPGGSSERVHIFCAQIDSNRVAGIHGLEEEDEDILVHVLDFNVAYALIDQGIIRDAKTIIALQWLALHKQSF